MLTQEKYDKLKAENTKLKLKNAKLVAKNKILEEENASLNIHNNNLIHCVETYRSFITGGHNNA